MPHNRIQIFLSLKRTTNKMSSVIPFTFNAVKLCIVSINEKPWTRAREVRRTLEYGKAIKAADVARHCCSKTDYAHK